MTCFNRLLLGVVSLLVGSTVTAQVPPHKALSTFTVADGLELQLWASEPMFVNPTCIDIDHRGRVWVCESVNYRTHLRKQPLRRAEGDRIVILEDSKGTGKADKSTTFFQSPDLISPLGIAVAKEPTGPGYKVYVCHSPDILVFEDKDGDGKADGPPKKLLSGFGGYDHDHGVHGILIGPDGKLYFSVGDTGVKDLQSADGKGRKWTSNTTDCRAGTVWRCDQDGKNLELLAHNFRNNYEPCVDSFGTVFISDNDDDGNQQTRICYVMPGGNYGYHPRGPGQSHWHEDQPGIVPNILRTGFGSPTGMTVYEGSLLPKKYQGQLLHTDAGPRVLRCYHLKPKGAGYEVDPEVMVSSTDTWFRPSDVCVAPDGSVFIADWYDPGVGGHAVGDLTRGRIYRLAPKGNKHFNLAAITLNTMEGVIEAVKSPCLAGRHMAVSTINGMNAKQLKEIVDVAFRAATPYVKARLAWAITRPINAGRTELKRKQTIIQSVMGFPEEERKALLPMALRVDRDMTGNTILKLVSEQPSSTEEFINAVGQTVAVNRELLTNSTALDAEIAKPFVYALANRYDGHDRFYLEAIGIAVGHHDQKRRNIILADFEKHFPEWNDKVADLVWELRPPQVLAKLDQRLTDPKLTAAQRGRIVDILAASDDLSAGKAMLKLLKADIPAEVQDRAIDNLRRYLPGKWRELRSSAELASTIYGLLKEGKGRRTALPLIAAAGRIAAIGAVSELAADARQPVEARIEAVQTLGQLHDPKAVRALALLASGGRKPPDATLKHPPHPPQASGGLRPQL